MTIKKNRRLDQQVVALFDALVAAPEGLDIHQIGAALNINSYDQRVRLFEIIRTLRLKLGAMSDDEDQRIRGYTVPIRREGTRYVYFLSALRADGLEWQGVRTDTLMSRLDVDIAYYQSLASVTDGRSRDGKIVRAITRRLENLVADISEIRELAD